MRVIAIIPAYNESTTIQRVITAVQAVVDDVVVVDDGSTDDTAQWSRACGVTVVSHPVNCGLGAALATGMMVARLRNADIAVTFDADGQLFPSDIQTMILPLKNKVADVVIGSRFLTNQSVIPLLRRFYNAVGNVITWGLFEIWTSDSQSGIRAFNRHALEQIHLRCGRMEVSSEFFAEIKKRNLRWQEVPIRVQYTPYSLSKGQGFLRGISTAFRLVLRRNFRL